MNQYKREILVVDFLNIGLLPIISKLSSKRKFLLIYLFSGNFFIEKLIKFVLKKKDINYRFIPFNAKKTYKTQCNLADEISLKFIRKFNLKQYQANNYLDISIGNIFYKKIYRIIAPYIFIKNLNLKNPKIYFNKSKISESLGNHYLFKNLNYYRAIGQLKNQNYFYEYNEEKSLFFKSIKIIFKLIYVFLNSFKNSLPEKLKYKPVFFVHSHDNSFFKLISKKIKEPDYSYLTFYNGYKIKFENKNYDIRCLNIFDIFHVFKESAKLLDELKSSNFLNFYDKMLVIQECFSIFYINNFLKKIKPPLFYSRNETMTCLLFQDLAKKYDCVTMASVFSHGYFPQKYEIGHQAKYCDIFFVWDEKHSDLILNSDDRSTYHIISGYGEDVNLLKKKHINYTKLICFCDNTLFDDFYLDKKEVFVMLKLCLKFAYQYDYKLVIKTKKYKNFYKDLMKDNSSVIIEIDDHIGSIQQYHEKTIFIGYGLFSLGILALKQNKLALFFDKYNMIGDEYSSILKNYIIQNERDFFIKIQDLSKFKLDGNKKFISNLINFDKSDGNEKITDYLISYLDNISSSKDKTLDKANKIYTKKWGDKSLVFNRHKSNFKFKSFM